MDDAWTAIKHLNEASINHASSDGLMPTTASLHGALPSEPSYHQCTQWCLWLLRRQSLTTRWVPAQFPLTSRAVGPVACLPNPRDT